MRSPDPASRQVREGEPPLKFYDAWGSLRSPADLQIVGSELQVRVCPFSAPRCTRSNCRLCAELSSTDAAYPGTDLVLRYSVKEPEPLRD